MQNDDKAFVNNLLSLSTQFPDAAASASTEAPPLAQGKSMASKLNHLAASERNEVCHQKWWKNIEWDSVEADSAAHLSSAELLASVKAAQD